MAERNVIGEVSATTAAAPVVVPLTGSTTAELRYSAAALEGVRRYALDKFLSIPRGGLEVGGLLLGRVSDRLVEILDCADFTIDYSSGPSFRLSQADEDALQEKLANTPSVIGWWHSHTRSDAVLSDEDLLVHQRFFPARQSVALVVKPFKFDPAQVVVYLPNSSDTPLGACGSFELDAPGVRERTTDVVAAPVLEAKSLTPIVLPLSIRPRSKSIPVKPRRAPARWIGAAVLLLAGYAWFAKGPATTPTVVDEPIELALTDTDKQLTVHWNAKAPAIRSSVRGELTVIDGAQVTRIPLGVDGLNGGSLTYQRQSARVEVRLRASSPDNQLHEAVAHFVGRTPEPVAVTGHAQSNASEAGVERMRAEVERLNEELSQIRSAAKSSVSTKPSSVLPAPPRVVTLPSPQRPAGRVPDVLSSQAAVALPPTVSFPSQQGSLTNAPAVLSTPTLATPAPAAPAPAAPTQALNAVVKQPSRGKAIWTGVLPRGSVLLIDGRKPSAGALTGRMPEGPNRMRVLAADLAESGVVVYTQTGKERIESPSAANGWNLTTYRPDSKRARDVTVLESPSSVNGWERVMVRSERRPLSMLVLEWEEIR